MMKLLNIPGAMAIIILSSFGLKSTNQKMREYFTLPGPIAYNKTVYHLSWTSHPSGNYYKQEYLPANENPSAFTTIFMIEAVVADISLKDAVAAKLSALEQRKLSDPATNYQVIENKVSGEYLLDFIITQSSGSKNGIAEWNAYRYVKLNDKNGRKGILLFAVSKRAYGMDIVNFLKKLKTDRQPELNSLLAYKLPGINIKAE